MSPAHVTTVDQRDDGLWTISCSCSWELAGLTDQSIAEMVAAQHCFGSDHEWGELGELPPAQPPFRGHHPHPTEADFDQAHAYAVDLVRRSRCVFVVALTPEGIFEATVAHSIEATLPDGRFPMPKLLREVRRICDENTHHLWRQHLVAGGWAEPDEQGGES